MEEKEMNKKTGIVAMVLGLFIMAMIPAAFADSNPDSPQLRCEGSNYRMDNVGITDYRLEHLDKEWTHLVRDPRYKSVYIALDNMVAFMRTPKAQACV